MKKSFFMLLAIVSTCVLGMSLSSCSKDDSIEDTKVTYTVEYAVAADLYDLIDIKTTVTAGNAVSELPFNQSTTLKLKDGNDHKVMSTGVKSFEIRKVDNFATSTTCTLKSNWKEIISTKDKTDLAFKAIVSMVGDNGGDGVTSSDFIEKGDFETEEALEKYMTNKVAGIVELFTYTKK